MVEDSAATIGIVIFCHGDMAAGMLNAAEMIIGPQQNVTTVSIQPGDGRDKTLAALLDAIKKVDTGSGSVLLTDLPGGTPFNLTALMISEKLEMITGFNLPTLVNIFMLRTKHLKPYDLASEAVDHGRVHISIGTDLLQSHKES